MKEEIRKQQVLPIDIKIGVKFPIILLTKNLTTHTLTRFERVRTDIINYQYTIHPFVSDSVFKTFYNMLFGVMGNFMCQNISEMRLRSDL